MSTQQVAAALSAFIAKWLQATMPLIDAVKIDRISGKVQVKDALGWLDVGTFDDWLALARALGALKVKS